MTDWLRRSRAHAGLLFALAVSCAAGVALAVGLLGHHHRAESDAVHDSVRRPAGGSALVISAAADAQDDVDAVLRRTVDGAPLRLTRTTHLDVVNFDGASSPLRVVTVPDPSSHARIVDGRWPTSAREAVLQSTAARRTGVGVGTTLHSGRVAVRVVGTWTATKSSDPVWAGDPSVSSGRGSDSAGPLLVDTSVLDALGGEPQSDVVVSASPRLTSATLDAAARSTDRLVHRLDDLTPQPRVDSGLADRLDTVQSQRAAGRGLVVVALTLLAAMTAVGLRQVIRLLAEDRADDTRLRAARGMSRAQLTTADTLEAAAVAAVGATAGGLAAHWIWPGGAVLPVIAIAVVACAVLAARAGSASRPTARIPRGTLVVLLLAAIALAQLISSGTPVTRTAGGTVSVDPVASLAPALVLLAACLVLPLAVRPAIHAASRAAARRPGLRGALATRRLAREERSHRAAMVPLAVAVAFVVTAVTVVGTWSTLAHRSAELTNADDVRVALRDENTTPDAPATPLDPYAHLGSGVRAALTTEGRIDSEPLDVVAAGGHAPSELVDSEAPLRLRVGIDGNPRGTGTVWIWLSAEDGRAIRLRVAHGSVGALDDSAHEVRIPSGRWSLLGAQANLEGADDDTRVVVEGLAERSTTIELDRAHTTAYEPVRRVPSTLPVTITPAIHDLVGAGVGDTFSLSVPATGLTITTRVTAIDRTMPTVRDGRGVRTDLATLTAMTLAAQQEPASPDEMWIRTPNPRQVAAQAASVGVVPGNVTTSTPSSDVVRTGLDTWTSAAIGASLFTVLSLLATSLAAVRAARGEDTVLHALGLRSARLGRLRSLETVVAVVIGGVVGVISGGIVAATTGVLLARSAVPDRPVGLPVRLDLAGTTAAAGALILAVGALLAVVVTGKLTVRSSRRGRAR